MSRLKVLQGDSVIAQHELLLSLCKAVFGQFSAEYLDDRLRSMTDPSLLFENDHEGQAVGFKLGYRFSAQTYYSWLGGVIPAARKQGVAAKLMVAQHDWAADQGYRYIETRTRTHNRAMIIVNLKAGFQIVGLDCGSSGALNVLLRKPLRSQSTAEPAD